MRYLSKRRLFDVAAVVSVLALTTACGSGRSAGNEGSSTSRSTGATIVLGSAGPIASSVLAQPERKAAIEAAISSINKAGGVNGRPLKLEYCDTKDEANGELTCLRQLTDKKVTAIVGPGLIVDQAARGQKFATAAHIPIIGSQGLTPTDFQIDGIFPLGAGIPGWSYGQVASILNAGAKKIALFGTGEVGSEYILSFTRKALESAGVQPVRKVAADPNADPTLAQSAAKVVAGDVDGVIFDGSPTYVPKAVSALRAAGFTGYISTISAIVGKPIIDALGKNAEGMLVSSQLALPTQTTNQGVAAFLADMKTYAPDAEVNDTALMAWSAVRLFADVAKSQGEITNQSIWDAFENLSTPVDIKTVGPYQVKGVTSPLPDYPRIFNSMIVFGVVKDGKLEPVGNGAFVNPFKTLESLKPAS